MTRSSATTVQQIHASSMLVLPPRKRTQASSFSNPKEVEGEGIPLIEQEFPLRIVWRNVALFSYLHLAAIYGIGLFLTGHVMWQTVLWVAFLFLVSSVGVTAGCHRLWSHKSYKAKLPLRILLGFMQTLAFQNSIHEWARDHRVHHKYSETHADPHNATRGFFFAHMGWLLCRKHPALIQKGKGLDLSDLEADSVVMFQKRYYLPLVIAVCFILPPFVSMYFWGESFLAAWFFGTQFRYCINLHTTWLVNSAAHIWGNKPYDKSISPSENKFVSLLAVGEGWHNYHHTFPWDYKTDELGHYRYNITTAFLDFMAWIGWAYDLKTVPKEVVMARIARTGDGTHPHEGAWGWGDKDIPVEDSQVTQVLSPGSDDLGVN